MASISNLWTEYLQGQNNPTAQDFGIWLIRKGEGVQLDTVPFQADLEPGELTIQSAILVGRLQRFLHFLTKPFLKNAGISEDELVVLASLLFIQDVPKTVLLKQCLIEIPTGSELLKRMKKSGLILEKKHPGDARSSIISISAKGKKLILHTFYSMNSMEDALQVLSLEERTILVELLNKLDNYHSHRHEILQMTELMKLN
ncbi:MarR family winged helix-turn-helix transcriptional regulator [Flavihumibacter sp. UBA7668]|uniref:MarR family winged helix-turn-helix transcriptional regulator n=1 Tax=Flavihumibacter sp. UBA7668 TaxID=1946542 RepID=UPI0025BA5675|nr:MarR family winged helix-turn-helix transcriptional regulator [Flavihumibacter sp. UBA7668]